MSTFQVDERGYYGEFGGAYVPEILHRCVEELRSAYREVLDSDDFQREFRQLLRDYVGRPSLCFSHAGCRSSMVVKSI